MKISDKMNIWEANENNIWNYQQNHPELVIQDIKDNYDIEFDNLRAELILLNKLKGKFTPRSMKDRMIALVRQSMLVRGVNKWLKVRRDLIAYKKGIKNEVIELQNTIPLLKEQMTATWIDFNKATPWEVHEYHKARELYIVAKELLKYKQKVRADLKNLCMTDRWQKWTDKEGNPVSIEDMNSIKHSDNKSLKDEKVTETL